MNVNLLTHIPLPKDAQRLFESGIMVYMKFKPKYYWQLDNKYYRLKKEFSFDENKIIVASFYENKEGFFKYYTDNLHYPISVQSQSNHTQLSLF